MSASISTNAALAAARFLDGVIVGFRPAPTSYPMTGPGGMYSRTTSPVLKVEFDYELSPEGGMVPPTVRDTEAPIRKGGSMQRKYVECMEYREKYRLSREEVVGLRKLGTFDQVQDPSQILTKWGQILMTGVQVRMEWLAWQGRLGNVTINENGINVTYPFVHPAFLNYTVGTLWTDSANANPINDFMDAQEITRRFNFPWVRCIVNSETAKVMAEIDQFRQIFKNTFFGFSPNQLPPDYMAVPLVQDIIKRHMTHDPVTLEVFDGRINRQIPTTELAVVGTNSVKVDTVDHIEVGDDVIIMSKDTDDMERHTVAAVNPLNRRVAFADALGFAFSPESVLHVSKPFLPYGKAMFLPAIGTPMVPEIGRVVIGPTIYNPGSLDRPVSSIFSEVESNVIEPKWTQVIVGAEMAVLPTRVEGSLTLTVA